MAGQQGKHRALGAFKPAGEISLDLVTDQPRAAPGSQPLRRLAQHMAQEFHAFRLAQSLIQPHAIAYAPGGATLHRVEHQFRPAQLYERAVPVILRRRPAEQRHCRLLAYKYLQRLAGLVPVNEKHDARAKKLQEFFPRRRIPRGEAPSDEIERILLQPGGLTLGQRTPLSPLAVEHGDKKFRTHAVDVRVSHAHRLIVHMHHQHMRVRGADVVLDGEMPARAHGGGLQPRMPKGERRRAVKPAHESLDRVTVLRGDGMDARPVQRFHSTIRRQPVKCLMHVHDQQMHAVRPAARGGGKSADFVEANLVLHAHGELRGKRLQPRGEGSPSGGIGGLQRRQHGGEISLQPRQQRERTRQI